MQADKVLRRFYRILVAALFVLVAMGLIGSGSEFLGLVAILVAFSLAVRGSFEVIFHVIVGLAVIAVTLTTVWLPFGTFGNMRFFDWIVDYWYLAVFYCGLVVFTTVRQFASRDETWHTLSERFAVPDLPAESLERLPSARGLMKIYEDMIPVTVYQSPSGFRAERRGLPSLLFPWSEIAETRPPLRHGKSGTVYVRKGLGIPIPVEIPWSPQFRVIPHTSQQESAADPELAANDGNDRQR